jgi:hypothetical protein
VDTPDNPLFLQATAVLRGTEIFITGANSQDHTPVEPWRDAGTLQARLDSSTLSGTWWAIYNSFNTTTRTIETGYGAGTMTFMTCP